jgi:hypothetical protein
VKKEAQWRERESERYRSNEKAPKTKEEEEKKLLLLGQGEK